MQKCVKSTQLCKYSKTSHVVLVWPWDNQRVKKIVWELKWSRSSPSVIVLESKNENKGTLYQNTVRQRRKIQQLSVNLYCLTKGRYLDDIPQGSTLCFYSKVFSSKGGPIIMPCLSLNVEFIYVLYSQKIWLAALFKYFKRENGNASWYARMYNVNDDAICCKTPPPNLNSPIFFMLSLGPNLKTANVSAYTVHFYVWNYLVCQIAYLRTFHTDVPGTYSQCTTIV